MTEVETPDLTTLTVTLLSAYVANNTVESGGLAGLIQIDAQRPERDRRAAPVRARTDAACARGFGTQEPRLARPHCEHDRREAL